MTTETDDLTWWRERESWLVARIDAATPDDEPGAVAELRAGLGDVRGYIERRQRPA